MELEVKALVWSNTEHGRGRSNCQKGDRPLFGPAFDPLLLSKPTSVAEQGRRGEVERNFCGQRCNDQEGDDEKHRRKEKRRENRAKH